MAKVPLTEAGVETKLRELYALPQNDLDAEALDIATDFKNWIGKSFDLTPAEQGYLSAASVEFTRFLSSILYAGVRNKLPIKFIPPRSIKAAKRFKTQSSYNFDYQWTGNKLSTDTDMTLQIIYE